MQLVVIVAFIAVLSMPETGWSAVWLAKPVWVWTVLAGVVTMPGLIAWLGGAWVRRGLARSGGSEAQARKHAKVGIVVRTVLAGGFLLAVAQTSWPMLVRVVWGLGRIPLVDELVILAPFTAGLILAWMAAYPAEAALRGGGGGGREGRWSLRKYLVFQVRHQLLLVAVPMSLLIVIQDVTGRYHGALARATGVWWASEAVMAAGVLTVFVTAPVLLRWIWATSPMAPGPLRDRLEALCGRIGLRYRAILLWRSDRMVINAAVMGLTRQVRYLMLSDGLVDSLDENQIAAVFGHEAGHIKHHHLTYYGVFAAGTAFIVGGVHEAGVRWFGLELSRWDQGTWASMMGMIAVMWLGVFGAISRRFERQADLFGLGCVADDLAAKGLDGGDGAEWIDTAKGLDGGKGDTGRAGLDVGKGIDATTSRLVAAGLFADTLLRIALLSGMSPHTRSWRHSSIASRMAFVRRCAEDEASARRFARQIRLIKALLIATVTAGSAIAAWLYWPPSWRW